MANVKPGTVLVERFCGSEYYYVVEALRLSDGDLVAMLAHLYTDTTNDYGAYSSSTISVLALTTDGDLPIQSNWKVYNLELENG